MRERGFQSLVVVQVAHDVDDFVAEAIEVVGQVIRQAGVLGVAPECL
ncbi:MAG: hypothetical protein JNG90_08975 [Planctomycetaceae bacterium]|nr:hypothetical protein [Planctomycetaceae bacterium]